MRLGTTARQDERGFTLVELLVTLGVVAGAVVAVTTVFTGALDAGAASSARARALAIAQRELAAIRSLAYEDVALPVGGPTTFEGDEVVVATTAPTARSTTVADHGLRFTVDRWIVWQSDSAGTPHAIKRVAVVVSWAADGGIQEARLDTAVYPGGLPPVGTAATPPGTPSALTAAGDTADPSQAVVLAWVPGVPAPQTWEVQQSADAGLTWSTTAATVPGFTLSRTVTGLAPSTTYLFRVRGVSGAELGGFSAPAAATTGSPAPACVVTTAWATPTTVSLKTSGALASNVLLTVNTAGTCGTLFGRVANGSSSEKVFTFLPVGSIYTHTIGKTDFSDWTPGTKTVRVQTAAGATLATITIQVS